jgi:hypothetical protein
VQAARELEIDAALDRNPADDVLLLQSGRGFNA